MGRHNAEHTAITDEFGLARIIGADEPSGVIRAIFALLGALVAGFHGSVHLVIENAALRQQLAVFKQKRSRPVRKLDLTNILDFFDA